jgi:hypothetical protein
MGENPHVTRLRLAGFTVLPSLDANGFDTGLLFARQVSTHLEVVSAWRDDYALAARLPYARNWLKPFEPTIGAGSEVVSFADAVDQLLNVRSQDGYGASERAEGKPWLPGGER